MEEIEDSSYVELFKEINLNKHVRGESPFCIIIFYSSHPYCGCICISFYFKALSIRIIIFFCQESLKHSITEDKISKTNIAEQQMCWSMKIHVEDTKLQTFCKSLIPFCSLKLIQRCYLGAKVDLQRRNY